MKKTLSSVQMIEKCHMDRPTFNNVRLTPDNKFQVP